MDGRDRSGPRRFTADGPDDVGNDVTDGGGGSAERTARAAHARRRTAAREHKRKAPGRSGRHGELTGDRGRQRKINGRRRRRGGSGEALRVDDGDDAPAVFGGSEGADEDGDATASTTAAFPSDGDGWNDGGARLERRRRRQS
jgi:Domain of unknown function (DUF834).